jgi:hypothetical protein
MTYQQTDRAELVGLVLRLGEPEYLYGSGALTLRITEIYDFQQYEGQRWLFLRGMRLGANGAELGERNALVKVTAIRRHADIRVPPTGRA